jgi:tetratricopeptide (TPR) repeat protein
MMTFKGGIRFSFLVSLIFTVVLSFKCCYAIELDFPTDVPPHDGPANYAEGKRLFQESSFEMAAMHLWRALLMQAQNKEAYPVEVVFQEFLQCFVQLGRVVDGLTYVAQESISRGQYSMGKMYLAQALEMDPNHEEAQLLKKQLMAMGAFESEFSVEEDAEKDDNEFLDDDLMNETPEKLYEIASDHFASREYEKCADVFEISCQKSAERLFPSCSNAVYCRNMITDWGFNGTQFEKDMKRIEKISRSEAAQYRRENPDGSFTWLRAMSTHPHMMLGFPVDPILKRYVAESAAFVEDLSQRIIDQGKIAPLPSDLPYDPQQDRIRFVSETSQENNKIRIGFVSSGFISFH